MNKKDRYVKSDLCICAELQLKKLEEYGFKMTANASPQKQKLHCNHQRVFLFLVL